MKFGVVVTDDDYLRGGEEGVGRYFIERFSKRSNHHNDEFIPIYAISGKLPDRNEVLTFDGFIITGSHHSVNDDKQWIRRLENFIRQVYYISKKYNKPRVYGMCFGHQIIAKALGGKVGRNDDNKFHFGSVKVQISKDLMKESFLRKEFENKQNLKMMKLHGECVLELPKKAKRVGTSEHCLNEVLKYGNHMLTSQGHPEYTSHEMFETNTTVVERHLDRLHIDNRLNELEIDDIDGLTEMVRNFLRCDDNSNNTRS